MARKKRITKTRAKQLRKLYFEHTINGDYLGELFDPAPQNPYEEFCRYITKETDLLKNKEDLVEVDLLKLYQSLRDKYYQRLGAWGEEYAQLLRQEAADVAKAKREQDELNDLLA